MPPRGFKTAPRRLQVPSELPKEPPKRPNSFNTTVLFLMSCHFSAAVLFFYAGPQDGPSMAKRAPRGAKEGTKMAPRAQLSTS